MKPLLPEPSGATARAEGKPGRVPFTAAASDAPAEIVLSGYVGWEITYSGVSRALSAIGADTPVTVRINSEGGVVTEGAAIYNALARHLGRVTVIVDGVAASMASIIAMAGDTIIMPQMSWLMIHNPSGMCWGDAADMLDAAAMLESMTQPMIAIYAARTGQTPEAVTDMMNKETWMGGQAAKDAGFCDVIEGDVAPTASLDLSQFRNVPAAATAWARPRAAMTTLPPVQHPAATAAITQENPMTTAVVNDTHPNTPPKPVVAALLDLEAIATRGGLDANWVLAQMRVGATLDQAKDAALDAVAANRPTARGPRFTAGLEQSEKKMSAMVAALEHRITPGKGALPAESREFRGMSMVEMAADLLTDANINTRGKTKYEIIAAAFRHGRATAAAGEMTTSDFPSLLANVAQKSLRTAYEDAPRTFLPWTRQQNLSDFKASKIVALSGAPTPQLIPESGEIKFASLTDSGVNWSLLRYGNIIPISYMALVNDDMNGFGRIPMMQAAAAARLESDIVYGLLLANAALGDGVALFHATHGNLFTGGTSTLTADANGIAAVGALAARMNKQTAPAPASSALNLMAKYLLAPSDLGTVAAQLFSGRTMASTPGSVNPYDALYTTIVEPRLSIGVTGYSGSATAFYLVSDPNACDTIVWGHLEGQDGPQLSSDIDFNTDGMLLKSTHTFGAAVVDHRGLAKSAGA